MNHEQLRINKFDFFAKGCTKSVGQNSNRQCFPHFHACSIFIFHPSWVLGGAPGCCMVLLVLSTALAGARFSVFRFIWI